MTFSPRAIEAAEEAACQCDNMFREVFDRHDRADIIRAALTAALAVDGVALQGWRTFEDRPESGRKFVALYNDGSGATMFCALYGGVIDSDGDEYYSWNPDDASYDLWAYLPDTMNFWCEVRAEDPVLLSQTPAASDREERR